MRLLLAFCFLVGGHLAFSQTIFQNISFEEAVNKARQEGKLIFLQFESADCRQCNEVANKGLDNAPLRDKLSASFVCVRISPTHPDRDQVGNLYNISKGF